MGKKSKVQSVTSVGRPLSREVHDRTMRYLLSMTVRTICIVAAFVVDGWLTWLLVVGAVVLPYVAVIMANAGRERPAPADAPLGPAQLEPGRGGGVPIDLKGGYLR